MIAVVPSMVRLGSATSRRTPSEPDYFEDLAGDALVDTRPAERDVLQDGRGQNRPPQKAPVSVAGEGLALIVNTSAGTASTRLARRLAADLPEAMVIETDAGDLSAQLRLAAASARILGVAGGDGTVSAAAAVAPESDSGDTRPV